MANNKLFLIGTLLLGVSVNSAQPCEVTLTSDGPAMVGSKITFTATVSENCKGEPLKYSFSSDLDLLPEEIIDNTGIVNWTVDLDRYRSGSMYTERQYKIDVRVKRFYDFINHYIVIASASTTFNLTAYVWEPRTNSAYKFHTVRQSWPSALATCAQEGGYLAIINSDTEAEILSELYYKTNASLTEHITQNVLLGFTYRQDSRTWITIHGQSLKEAGFDKWDRNQPDNKSSQCGAMFEYGLLDDVPCLEVRPFICEKDSAPQDSTSSTSTTSTTEFYGNELEVY